MSLPDETGRFELVHRPGKETPCPQPFSTCPSPSTGSLPGSMRDRTTASVMAENAYTIGRWPMSPEVRQESQAARQG
jgi:hypothetical protein